MDIVEATGNNSPSLLVAVEQAVSERCWERARGLFARLARLPDAGPGSPELVEQMRHTIDTALLEQTDWPQARIRWRAALAEFPDEPAIWPFAASCFMHADAYDDAEHVLRLMCGQEPENAEIWIYLAMNAERQHRWSDAVDCWNHVVALKPNDHGMKAARGLAVWNKEMSDADHGEYAAT